jgi:hypothetical protein
MFYLAAGDGEDTFWIQLLVMVVLGAGVGTYGVFKKHKARHGTAGAIARHFLDSVRRRISGLRLAERFQQLLTRFSQTGQTFLRAVRLTRTKLSRAYNSGTQASQLVAAGTPVPETVNKKSATNEKPSSARPHGTAGRNFEGGMELLTSDFLVEVVEKIESVEIYDITMRNLCFCELVRRNALQAVSSDALKAYTLNTDGTFDKSIRYQAMRELAHRTANAPLQSR